MGQFNFFSLLFYNTFMLLVLIISIPVFCASVYCLVKLSREYTKRYKSFIDFLRLEDDAETLKVIGYVEFYGEEYGLRKIVSIDDAVIQLYNRYDETKKEEYLNYAVFLEGMKKKRFSIILAFFISFFLLGFAIESIRGE